MTKRWKPQAVRRSTLAAKTVSGIRSRGWQYDLTLILVEAVLIGGVFFWFSDVQEDGRQEAAEAREDERQEAASVLAFQVEFAQKEPVGAQLSLIRLPGLRAPYRDFSGARLEGADLSGAQLYKAVFQGAALSGTDFSGASLSETDFSDTRIVGANFSNTDLRGADLTKASFESINFNGADLSGALLTGVKFVGADFSGTNFSGSNLEDADLTTVLWNEDTAWPEGYEPPVKSSTVFVGTIGNWNLPTGVWRNPNADVKLGDVPQNSEVTISCTRNTGVVGEGWWFRIEADGSWPGGWITREDVVSYSPNIPEC